MYGLAANLTVIFHFIFIVFVIFGAFLLFLSKKIAGIHIPAVIYGVYIELTHTICPLTYLENWFLNKANLISYSSSFIEYYLIPVIYPRNLNVEIQFYLGVFLIVINIIIYVLVIISFKRN